MEVLVLKSFSMFRLKSKEKYIKETERSEQRYLCIYNLNLYYIEETEQSEQRYLCIYNLNLYYIKETERSEQRYYVFII
jgi:hypothetical protein